MEVFENIGFRLTHNETAKLFKKAGADVSKNGEIVKIPRKLFNELLSLAVVRNFDNDKTLFVNKFKK